MDKNKNIKTNDIINELIELLKKQNPKGILYISESGNILDSQKNYIVYEKTTLQSFLDNKTKSNSDVILIDSIPINYDSAKIVCFINEMLSYVNQSLIIIDDMYIDEEGHNTNMLSGKRRIHPVLLSDFDFSYKIIKCNSEIYQVYNFFPPQKFDILDQDKIYETYSSNRFTMNIAYVLPHLNLTGGMKYILSHAKFLKQRGHNVYLMYEGADVSNVIPKWSDLNAGLDVSGQIIITSNEEYAYYLEKHSIDVMVAGFYTQIDKLKSYNVPVLYWEQGSESLYGEFKELLTSNSNTREKLRNIYRSNIHIASVSPIVSRILEKKYGRITPVLYTGIDTDFYHPSDKPWRSWPQILLVGSPFLRFKGFDLIISVLEQLWNDGVKFQVIWAMQHNPINCEVSFPIEMACQVSQNKLADLYRNADLLINASHFESFPMPPMEAFASETAVVAVNNGGIEFYAKPGENILLAEQGNADDLYSAVKYLLEKPKARNILAKNAIKDSQKYSVSVAIDQLEEILTKIIIDRNKRKPYQKTKEVLFEVIENDNENIETINNFNGLKEMIKTGEGLEAIFSFKNKNILKSRLDVLADLCRNKKILHIGCSDHLPLIDYKIKENIWLHGILTKNANKVLGIDINMEALDYLKQKGVNNVIYGDITLPNNKNIKSENWDYAVFAEVLEHIDNPVEFLRNIKNNYQDNISHCVITVPNAFGLPFVNNAILRGEERVNPDHKYWFTPYTLWKVINEAGLEVEMIDTCAYENSYNYLMKNIELVLAKPILQDTIIAICKL
jgi:glycosyltransferase involved in cell wall biosynthesis/2-polyprenyl-3-methyl-5-hydroxy-6-metoxy-1,4-benzoquinol methylase